MRRTRTIPKREVKAKTYFVMSNDGSLKPIIYNKIDYERPLIKQLLK